MIPFPYKDENPSPSSRLPIWAIIGLNLAAIVFWTQEGVGALGFLQELLLRARGVPVNQGAQAAFKRKLPDSAVLADLDRVERYLGWHLQLVALRQPALARP